jgi:GDP-L-fucose synthase
MPIRTGPVLAVDAWRTIPDSCIDVQKLWCSGMTGPSPVLTSSSHVYVAGHRGLVGSAVTRALNAAGVHQLALRTSSELDLRDRDAVYRYVQEVRPDVVILAAARVGGILANSTYPADFLSDNLQIQVNVLDAARRSGVQRLLFLGSSCIYPKHAPQPMSEDALLTGPLEPTNSAYAIAKISGILQVQAVRRQSDLAWIAAMPTNLYGPGDNFDLADSHVLAAMIRKFHEAKRSGGPVTLWGSGSPRREFLHVDDLAAACLHLINHYDDPRPINVGSGRDITIRDLASLVASSVGYHGDIVWDASKPDGTPRKLLDVGRIQSLGWKPQIRLEDGIRSTYEWYVSHESEIRG